MADFNVRSDAVNVEQIMEQVRARIREKRGVDYTEAEVRELASVKLDRFLDPRGVRSDLLEQFKRSQVPPVSPELPNFAFEDDTLFASTRGPIRWIRKLLLPILKLFFNPNPLIQALHIQARLNAAAPEREAKRDQARYAFDRLHYEVMHNLVVELTRLGIEVKNLKMQIESVTSRLEFSERRARALESVVVYRSAPEERPARNDRGERSERNDRSERSDRGDRVDRGDRGDRAERTDRGDRNDSRRPDPPMPRPQVEAQPRPAPPVAEPAADIEAGVAAPVEGQPAAAPTPEGPGQRSRRRRRRRGRRGNGAAATLMGGGGQAGEPAAGPEDGDSTDGGADEGDNGEGVTEVESSPVAATVPHQAHERAQADSVEAPRADDSTHTAPIHDVAPAPEPAPPVESSPEAATADSHVQQPAAHDPSVTPEQ
jgi:hypothetical protein